MEKKTKNLKNLVPYDLFDDFENSQAKLSKYYDTKIAQIPSQNILNRHMSVVNHFMRNKLLIVAFSFIALMLFVFGITFTRFNNGSDISVINKVNASYKEVVNNKIFYQKIKVSKSSTFDKIRNSLSESNKYLLEERNFDAEVYEYYADGQTYYKLITNLYIIISSPKGIDYFPLSATQPNYNKITVEPLTSDYVRNTLLNKGKLSERNTNQIVFELSEDKLAGENATRYYINPASNLVNRVELGIKDKASGNFDFYESIDILKTETIDYSKLNDIFVYKGNKYIPEKVITETTTVTTVVGNTLDNNSFTLNISSDGKYLHDINNNTLIEDNYYFEIPAFDKFTNELKEKRIELVIEKKRLQQTINQEIINYSKY